MPPNNRAIASRFNEHWFGNIVITAHGKQRPDSIINVRTEDLSLIDLFLSQ